MLKMNLINPFTAEVSANVFASAENNPLEYVVKCFYPNKERYPEQIRKLIVFKCTNNDY